MSRFLLAAGMGIALSTLACVAAAQTGPSPAHSAQNVRHIDTWGHPDQFGEDAGIRLLADGRYKAAMKYFKISARYADKASQLMIGLMYANGRGTGKNPVKACAWLTLAAQRKFPTFIATRDRICDSLTDAQRKQAGATVKQLLPVYGDKIAKQRMAFALKQARMMETGSRAGFNYGIDACSGPPFTSATPTPAVCGNDRRFWSPWRWDPKKYFAARNAYWMGKVTVGPLMDIKTPTSKGNPPATGTSDH